VRFRAASFIVIIGGIKSIGSVAEKISRPWLALHRDGRDRAGAEFR
jgi:hypothetical protein